MQRLTPRKKSSLTNAAFFIALALLLFSLSPGSIQSMGYMFEEMNSGRSLLTEVASVLPAHPPPQKLEWSRHGILPVLLDTPFLIIGQRFSNPSEWQDRLLALRPILLTAGMALILFLWIRQLTARPLWAFTAALIGVFSTILWPYAYMGLEDMQSFFLLLSAYLAFARAPASTWQRTVLFAASLALAVSSKSTGAFLIPAAAFLVWVAFRDQFGRRRARVTCVCLAVMIVFCVSAYSRTPFWNTLGGRSPFLELWFVPDPLYFLANLFSFFFNPNKGLFFYCPVLLAALWSLPRLWATERSLVVFSLLVVAGLAFGFSLLRVWSDETWGPRYLHSAVAPLIVCFGAGWVRRTRSASALIASAAALGFVFAFLGAFFYYGALHDAMTDAGQDTLENIQSDIVWNPIRFNARLFWIWIEQSDCALFTPGHEWYYNKPPHAQWTPVEISKYGIPQPLLVQRWSEPLSGTLLACRRAALASMILGFILLAGLAASIHRAALPPPPAA